MDKIISIGKLTHIKVIYTIETLHNVQNSYDIHIDSPVHLFRKIILTQVIKWLNYLLNI